MKSNTKNLRTAIVGMPQGGTTALYNIVNFILRHNEMPVENFLYHPTLKYNKVVNEQFLRGYEGPASILVKEHHFIPFLCNEWSDIIFVMKRDIRDSIASRRRRGKALISKGKVASGLHTYNPKTFEGFQQWCDYLTYDCYQAWVDEAKKNKRNIHEFDYISYKQDPDKTVRVVFEALKNSLDQPIELDEKKVVYDINNLNRFDKDITFFSSSKVTNQGKMNGYKDYLSVQELEFIDNNFQEWIDKK